MSYQAAPFCAIYWALINTLAVIPYISLLPRPHLITVQYSMCAVNQIAAMYQIKITPL